MKHAKYRMIGVSGTFDFIGNNQDRLIALASKEHGVFNLWAWDYNGNGIWKIVETFIF